MGTSFSSYDQPATDSQSGVELGFLAGEGRIVGEGGFRVSHGESRLTNGSMLESKQTSIHVGARAYAHRGWLVQPYVGGGVAQQRHELEAGWEESDTCIGLYWRVGADVRIMEDVDLTISFQDMSTGTANIGNRRVDLSETTLMVGISFKL